MTTNSRSRLFYAGIVALAAWLGGCEAEHAGDRCDGFFANGCKGGMTCFSDGSQKVCAKSCDSYGGECQKKEGCCADPGFVCHPTFVQGPGMPPGGAQMGGYCFNK